MVAMMRDGDENMTLTNVVYGLITALTALTLIFAALAVRVRLETTALIQQHITQLKETLRFPGDRFELSGPAIAHPLWRDYVGRNGFGILRRLIRLVSAMLLMHLLGFFVEPRLVMLLLFIPFADAVGCYIQLSHYADLIMHWDSVVQTRYIEADVPLRKVS
ncbi:hypothetical protein L248_1323 [Schleiferilactobacillus shenzhenensis LY-73]|uniref:Uncharacterized protein n=2 Tax=Schleiferilactobacillus shenzhenensis TaxID=1231337 RepID=U4TMX0_9LACO|nr:hypothetical protein L248_1323 [Schleiferilactobacillus shenzhenensis LY-73]